MRDQIKQKEVNVIPEQKAWCGEKNLYKVD